MNNMQPSDIRSTAEGRFALRVTARLSESAEDLPSDISERLRIARQQALQVAVQARAMAKPAAVPVFSWVWAMATSKGSGEPSGSPWLRRLVAFLPLIVLLAGLLGIQELHSSHLISTAAEIDAALLADDLPPDAYLDVGFLEYLKRPPETE